MASKKKLARPRRRRKQDGLIGKLRHYVRTTGAEMLKDPNVTSVGIGYKITGGERGNKLCLQFTVADKPEGGVGLEELGTSLIPETLSVDGEEIPTDVVERRFEPSFQLVSNEDQDVRKERLDPMVPGISVSHPSGSAGTLGLVVFDRKTGDPCMLSNWHVLHRATGEIGDGVVQPGPFDDNNLQFNHAGTLVRSHLGPPGDCAIARIEDRDFEPEILELGVAPAELARVDLDDVVIKSGRTTGVTRGVVRRIDVMAEITYPGVGAQQIGCFEIGPEEGAPTSFEVSLGGDSGSGWLIANDDGSASTNLAGLHFAGETSDNPDEHALACYAHSVFTKLDITLDNSTLEDRPPSSSALGYDLRFLSTEVPTPSLSSAVARDVVRLEGSHLIPYAHFSVCLSRSRGLARFVAWNIDGGRLRRISRRGIRFRVDPRIPDRFQQDNELYRNNRLDRGHIARRADLIWGSLTEARRANVDSFFFTNIAPQHESFNQSSRGGLWGELENAVFADVDVEDLKVSVIGGPVFRDDDPRHRGVRIPRDFWKLIAYVDTVDNALKVSAFMLTQRDLLSDLEALDLDPFRVFQVSLSQLGDDTGLDFAALSEFDTFDSGFDLETLEERPVRAREVLMRGELFV